MHAAPAPFILRMLPTPTSVAQGRTPESVHRQLTGHTPSTELLFYGPHRPHFKEPAAAPFSCPGQQPRELCWFSPQPVSKPGLLPLQGAFISQALSSTTTYHPIPKHPDYCESLQMGHPASRQPTFSMFNRKS